MGDAHQLGIVDAVEIVVEVFRHAFFPPAAAAAAVGTRLMGRWVVVQQRVRHLKPREGGQTRLERKTRRGPGELRSCFVGE
jgi:hypothetical protein